jgi:hypothetical protein
MQTKKLDLNYEVWQAHESTLILVAECSTIALAEAVADKLESTQPGYQAVVLTKTIPF